MGQLVSGYLDFAERQAEREQVMTMADWAKHLDGILTSTGEKLLIGAGSVRYDAAMKKAAAGSAPPSMFHISAPRARDPGTDNIRNTTRKGWYFLCGLYWTRTSDPIDVNDVLYQLSQQTTFRVEQKGLYHAKRNWSRVISLQRCQPGRKCRRRSLHRSGGKRLACRPRCTWRSD